MISLKVVDIKNFTKSIFVDSVFDNFVTSSVEVVTFNKFNIDGRLNRKWFSDEELESLNDEYSKWADLKKYAYEMIKGSKVPTSFKIVLLLSKENMANTLSKYTYQFLQSDVEGLFINIIYQNNEIHIVPGVSYKTFVMDKTLDKEWDSIINLFMRKNQIEVEEC